MRNFNFLIKDLKLFARFVIPSMLSMVTAGIYTLVDGLFVGWGAGSDGMAALNVAYPLALLLVALGEMIGIGGAINIALARGRGYTRSANLTLQTMMHLVWPVALLLPLVLLPNLKPLLRLMGAAEELLPAAAQYATIIIGAGVFQLLLTSLLEAMRNDNAPLKAMLILVVGLVLNVGFDYLFVIALHGGVAGSAWATVLAQACGLGLALLYFRRGKSELRLTWKRWKSRRMLRNRILLAGIPSFGVQLSVGVVILLHNTQTLAYGRVAGVAAYAVISYVESIVLLIVQGIALGLQPIVSFLHGAGKFQRRRRMAFYGGVIAVATGTAGMLLSITGRNLIPELFNAHGEVLRLATAGLLISAPVYPLIAFQKVSESYFQSMERTGAASLLIYLDSCVILPLCLFLLPMFRGLDGVWAAMPVSKAVMLLVVIALWVTGRKEEPAKSPAADVDEKLVYR